VTDGAYSFLAWLRTGLTTRITGEPGAGRATIPVQLDVTGDALEPGAEAPHTLVEQPVQLYGPGDVIGIDPRAISRMEPPPYATNFEPNYLAHIEFYEEDFAWRYSPAAPAATRRLTPWLALVVLAAGGDASPAEFEEGDAAGGPLPFITVTAPQALQPPAELGAFAHVHVNGSLAGRLDVDDATPGGMDGVLSTLAEVLRTAPDSACSRILCPRHLLPTTTYHAFVVPAFETGRRAGLGIEPGEIPATTPSWGVPGMPAPGRLPYYHRWQFTTSPAGDFEFLVRLLKPVEAAEPVGQRDMDAHRSPGFGLPELTTPTVPSGVLRLGGALQLTGADDVIDPYENWDNYYGQQKPEDPPAPPYPNQWQRALAGLLNLADAYQHQAVATANTALSAQIPDLAGQVDPVITPPLYGRWHALTPTLLKKPDGTDLPAAEVRNWVHRLNLDPRYRVAAHFGAKVVQARQEELMAAAWAQLGDARRANAWIRIAQLAREVGEILHGRHIEPRTGPVQLGAAAEPLASGRALTLTAPAHPKVLDRPAGARAAEPAEVVAVGFKVSRSRVAGAPVSPAMRRITRPGGRLMRTLDTSLDTLLTRIDEEQVAAAPPLAAPPGLVTPARLAERLPGAGPAFRVSAGTDADARPRLDVADTTTAVLTGLDANTTVIDNIVAAVHLPARLAPKDGELTEVMAYPKFDTPMYTELLRMSTDTFVPNLGLLPPNSITLLEPNRRFIESFLVGLNHEMARELLWREYPTDQRGTPFRQFWDPRTAPPRPDETAAARRERLYDIPPIHEWGTGAALGENPNPRPKPGEQPPRSGLVLVIRGELLRKYPTAAVYAHKAEWPDKPGQVDDPDKSGERTLAKLPDGVAPPHGLVRLPVFEAKVEPDIYLLGFDLDAAEARGEDGDLGWFFVLKERPGDPRFGLDEDQPGPPTRVEVWNDLSWGRVDPAGHGFVRFAGGPTVSLEEFNHDEDDQEKTLQRDDDVRVMPWQPDLSAADAAYILFQAPVLVAIHAQEMLPDAAQP